MPDPGYPKHEQFQRIMALHKYFLNADFLRDVFMRRIDREQSLAHRDFVDMWTTTSHLASGMRRSTS